ncbi:MAG: hypothetical protein KA753_11670, partial [Paludibacter sp.]|nr:hypothetical protein [Paludibacter sp.]
EFSDIMKVMTAANVVKTNLVISIDNANYHLAALRTFLKPEQIQLHTETEFINSMHKYERIRTCSANLSMEIYKKAAELGKHIAMQKPLNEGRLELLHYVKEQSIAFEYHRYGSITETPE